MNRLVQRAACQAIQRIRDSGHLIDHLVGHGGTLQNNRPPAPELQHAPRCHGHEDEHQRQKLLLPRNVYGSTKQMKWIVREHFILPAGLLYLAGFHSDGLRPRKQESLKDLSQIRAWCSLYSVRIRYTGDQEQPALGHQAARVDRLQMLLPAAPYPAIETAIS